ncbi:hypothetical protein GF377_06360 [candidate division GN15 bacterium]|nr:hypothetical protein [candidate division GN15 bacterium]
MRSRPSLVISCLVLSLCLGLCVSPGTVATAAQPATSVKSDIGTKLIETIQAGIPFDGMSASLDGASIWPGKLFLRLKDGTLNFDGHLEWTSLNHVNYVEGTIIETGDFVELDFTSTKILVKGTAASGVDYHSVATLDNGRVRLLGRWTSGDHRGPLDMTADPDLAGQQSSLLEGKSVNDLLAGRAAQEDAGKPEIIWREECIDWKAAGFEYPNGDRFTRLTCNWARDRLADGPSSGEMMIIVTNSDDSPLLCFKHDHGNWEKNLGSVDHIDIYFSQQLEYTLPVEGRANGWAYATDHQMSRRIIGSAQKDAQYLDSDMIIYTGLKGFTGNELIAHISTKGFKPIWIAQGYFMRGEDPPSTLEILQRDDY